MKYTVVIALGLIVFAVVPVSLWNTYILYSLAFKTDVTTTIHCLLISLFLIFTSNTAMNLILKITREDKDA